MGKFSKRWQAIKAEPDPTHAIGLAVDLADEVVIESETERADLRSMVKELVRIVSGNGDPTHSLVARIDRMEKDTMATCVSLAELRLLIRGDMSTKKDNLLDKIDGLDDRLAKVETSMSAVNKIMWMVVVVVIGQIVLKIVELF